METAELREECRLLQLRLEGHPHAPDLHRIYLDLVPLVGRLQGLVSERLRRSDQTEALRAAQEPLEQLKSTVRQVGLDIRLASEAALQVGLQRALECAFEVLDLLERER